MTRHIVWFRRDLRLHDNPAWAAGSSAAEVCPLFVLDPSLYRRVSSRRRALLVAGLRALDGMLQDRGGRLRVEMGDPTVVLPRLAEELGATRIHLNQEVTAYGTDRDRRIGEAREVSVHDGHYVHPPGSLLTSEGGTYRVFTPFHRAWSSRRPAGPSSEGTATISWDPGVRLPLAGPSPLQAGEIAALGRLAEFLARVDRYATERDRPDLGITSRLSVDLKFGFLSPREAVRRVGTDTEGRATFVRQLAWRDFHAHVLGARPELATSSLRAEYRDLAWRNDPAELAAWKQGLTGYPLVDAAMRQLVGEGWIHNRLRMVAASFLVKDLLVDWREGERFFRHHLLDGDVAQNAGNWQWVAGTGTDSAPYFRVLNPVTQSRRFDPEGRYIRSWVPELSALSAPAVHAPWQAEPSELAAAKVALGRDYPGPIVDHGEARRESLASYAAARRRAQAKGSR